MEETTAIKLIADFKETSLQLKLNEITSQLIGKSQVVDYNQNKLFEAALIVKKISAQIDEIVHAAGILNALPAILQENEKIESISLAAGIGKERFDLSTNFRIAEFKFSEWKNGNDSRKRQVFADCVNLLLFETEKKKELYVASCPQVKNFFQSNAGWKNMLSKSGGLAIRLQEYLTANKLEIQSVKDIFSLANIEVFDVDEIMQNHQSN